MESGVDDAYAELGLDPDASAGEVKAAWRRLAAQWHPDRNRSAGAIGRMQRINRALDEIRRHHTADDPGDAGTEPAASAPGSARSDRRENSDARDRRDDDSDAWRGDSDTDGSGPTIRTVDCDVKLTLEEALAGCIKLIRGTLVESCACCDGSGYRTLASACADCEGSGAVHQRLWFGWYGTSTKCSACGGDGNARQACDACDGKGKRPPFQYSIRVRVPHGVRDGDLLHVGGRRHASGHPLVELNLHVEVLAHALFGLDPDGTIRCTVPVNGFAWMANRSIDIPTLTGLQRLQLRRDELSYRLTGHGFPVERRGPRGDQLVTLQPVFPGRLSADQEILFDQLIATPWHPDDSHLAARLDEWRRAQQGWDQARAKRGRQPAG